MIPEPPPRQHWLAASLLRLLRVRLAMQAPARIGLACDLYGTPPANRKQYVVQSQPDHAWPWRMADSQSGMLRHAATWRQPVTNGISSGTNRQLELAEWASRVTLIRVPTANTSPGASCRASARPKLPLASRPLIEHWNGKNWEEHTAICAALGARVGREFPAVRRELEPAAVAEHSPTMPPPSSCHVARRLSPGGCHRQGESSPRPEGAVKPGGLTGGQLSCRYGYPEHDHGAADEGGPL